MREPPLRSASYEVAGADDANELFQRNGWTDGLPIVPPTEDGVRRFLAAAALAPDDVVGVEPVRRRRITAEKVAIAAIMAGCLPPYLPVVVACVRAMCEPEFGLHGATASTGGSAPFIVVNGPIRRAIGMNATHNVLANGGRANATIGRAIRLLIINVLGGVPGQLDRSTLGHPGKFTFCIAEDEEGSPWMPLAAERGVPAGAAARAAPDRARARADLASYSRTVIRVAGGSCRRAQPPRRRLRHPLARTPRCARRTGRGGPTPRGPAGVAPCATRPIATWLFANDAV
jgi:hypothetical protein